MPTGAEAIATTLRLLGVKKVFGLVGIPVIEIADAFQAQDIDFIAFRNEQAALYAASVYGYLTRSPGVLLVVGGPGIVHAMAGILNSHANRWPLLVIAGSAETGSRYKGAFQELNQLELVGPYTKFKGSILAPSESPAVISRAWRSSLLGTPGPVYVDVPGDIITSSEDVSFSLNPSMVPASEAPFSQVRAAAVLIKKAKFPLVLVGKGVAYANASSEVSQLVKKHSLPFIPTPMGKGVISDHSELNISSARSLALKTADVVIVLGARLNWILHFGDRFSESVKVIQVDSNPETLGDNCPNPNSGVFLQGDLKLVAKQLNSQLGSYKYLSIPDSIIKKIKDNNLKAEKQESTLSRQLNYHVVYKAVRAYLQKNRLEDSTILVSEGANTMDFSRIAFPITQPKHRLDAGTNSTMGVGLGYSIAAKAAFPEKTILAIEGDSAFGFSAMEIETAVRYGLGMVILVMNNSGIYHGFSESSVVKRPIELSKETRYDILATSLGGKGYLVQSLSSLEAAVPDAFKRAKNGEVCVLNVIIEPGKEKEVAFGWQNKPKSKL